MQGKIALEVIALTIADLIEEEVAVTQPVLPDLKNALRPKFKWRLSKHAPALEA